MSLRRERLDSGKSLLLNPSPKCHFGGGVTGCDLYAEAAAPPPWHDSVRPRGVSPAVSRPLPRAPPRLLPGPARPARPSPRAGCSAREGPWLAHAYSLHALPAHTRACRSRCPLRCHCAAAASSSRTPPSLLPSLPAAARPAPRCSVRAAPRLAGHRGQPLLAATEAGESDPKVTRNTLLKLALGGNPSRARSA